MRYDVHVAAHHGGDEGRFEHEQDEPLEEGGFIRVTNMVYRVDRITPCGADNAEFDAIVEAVWAAGPAQAERHPLAAESTQPV
jgi:hypothetical protein